METKKYGPWFWSFEGCWVIKRQMFDDHGNPIGYELLDGDYDELAKERASAMRDRALLGDVRRSLGVR